MIGNSQELILLSELNGGHVVVGSRDSRTGLGYGIAEPFYQHSRNLNSSYPYTDHDFLEDEDVEVDDDSAESITKKSINYYVTDPLSSNSTDSFYFVGGNTKLSDCFWRADIILSEISAFGDSMSPIPQLNSRRSNSLSGYSAAFSFPGGGGSSFKRTGTLHGWSKSPPPVEIELEDEESAFSEEDDTYSLKDLAKKDSNLDDILHF